MNILDKDKKKPSNSQKTFPPTEVSPSKATECFRVNLKRTSNFKLAPRPPTNKSQTKGVRVNLNERSEFKLVPRPPTTKPQTKNQTQVSE